VYIPGYTVQRINTAFAFGDFESLALTFEYNFGVHPNHYVMINFWSFVDIVDSLGGITVDVGLTLTDHRDGYGNYTVPAGSVHMDGQTVLWYVRARYTTSDFDRGRRQQEVLEAIGNRLLSLNALTRVPELYDIYRNNVTTDLSVDDVVSLLPLATKLSDTSRIHRYAIGPQQVYNWTNYSGAMVLVPVREAVLAVMQQALNNP
jgi:LCP family protein required for cell wall assembly